jgi:hypothetical protein
MLVDVASDSAGMVYEMICASPLDTPLSRDFYEAAVLAMRKHNVTTLAAEKCWAVLRDFAPSDWPSVLADLQRGQQTSKWFY